MSQGSNMPAAASRPVIASTRPERRAIEANPSLVKQNTLVERFARQLERKIQGEGGSDHDRSPAAAIRQDGNPLGKIAARGEERDGSDPQDRGHEGVVPVRLETVSARMKASFATPSTIDTALLERIAAQIAEVHPGKSNETALLTLPEGSIAQTASIARGADGALTIRIMGLDPRLSVLQADRLKAGLISALGRRRIDLAGLSVEYRSLPGDQLGRDSTTSRVV